MQKKELRKLYKDQRLSLEQGTRKSWENEILLHLISFLKSQPQIQHINLFLPIEKWKEINTYYLKNALTQSGLSYSYSTPKMLDKAGGMEMMVWDDSTQFEMNEWGIPEVGEGEIQATEAIDLILVPLLTFDERGQRVGYGGGYYDRYLSQANFKGIKLGLSYFEPCELISDTNEFDAPLDYVITPKGIHQFNS